MKSKDYWEKRSAEQLIDLLKDADNVIKELKLSYDKAIFNINTSIEKLYGKFAEDNRISVNEAMKIIKGDEYREWRMSMQEYLKRIERGEEPLQLELDVLAMRSRINRLECLQAEIIANATILAQDEDKTATKHLTDALESSYNNTMYEFYKDKDPAVLDLMNRHKVAISKDSVKEILQIPWSGANYSTRIWKRKFNIANKVKEMVTRNILEGKSITNITREVAKEFGAEYTNALKTLIHTETAFVKSQADKEVYKKLDVEEYEFMATLDRRTSEICRKLDGKHFKVDEAVPGENYPPMHPRCRSTTIRYKPEKYDTHTRMARDKDGKNIKVPLGMKYDEWYNKYIKENEKQETKTPHSNSNKAKSKKEEETLKELEKLKNTGLQEDDYKAYMKLIKNNSNVAKIYQTYGDGVEEIKLSKNSGSYSRLKNVIEFSLCNNEDRGKYSTLAHEYGHFFDNKMKNVYAHNELSKLAEVVPEALLPSREKLSSSDDFMKSVRADKDVLKKIGIKKLREDLLTEDASSGVQDAIDGFFEGAKNILGWGHGEKYYNRQYNDISQFGKLFSEDYDTKMINAYKELEYDVKSKKQMKSMIRDFETASEIWANIFSAETCGGKALDNVKKYLKNSYNKLIEMIKKEVEDEGSN